MKLRQIFEAPQKVAVTAFGRMNPPTIGHDKLVNKITAIEGDHYLFLSQTQKPKDNPLPFDVKLQFAKKFFPSVNVGHPTVRTPIQMLQMLEKLGYTDIVYVAGSDRVEQFEKLFNDYNGKEYNFNSIRVVSAGERDPDADGAEGMSASKMRVAAAAGDFDSFAQGVPSPALAQKLYDAVRAGMGVKEPVKKESFTDREFRNRERNAGLEHEKNNIQIAINGKPWKVVAGKGYADSAEERSYLQGMQRWAEKKSASSGKKWTVYLTGANVSESLAGDLEEALDPTSAISRVLRYLGRKFATAFPYIVTGGAGAGLVASGLMAPLIASVGGATAFIASLSAEAALMGGAVGMAGAPSIIQVIKDLFAADENSIQAGIKRWVEKHVGDENDVSEFLNLHAKNALTGQTKFRWRAKVWPVKMNAADAEAYLEKHDKSWLDAEKEKQADANKKPVGEEIVGSVDSKGRTQQEWLKLVKNKFPDAKIRQSKMLNGPIQAILPNGKTLSWKKAEEAVGEASLGTVLAWPEVVNKVNSAMKATGWKGSRKGDDAYIFSSKGQETDDQYYFAIIDNAGEGFFKYALGTVEDGDPYIDDAYKGSLPNTEASVSELMDMIRDGFGLGEGMQEGVRDLGYDAQSLIMKLRRDVEEKRIQATPQAVLAAARELAGDMDFAPQLLVKQVLGQGVAEAISKKDLISRLQKDSPRVDDQKNKNAKPIKWTGPGKDDYGYTGYQGHGMPTDKQERDRIRADKKKGVAEGGEYNKFKVGQRATYKNSQGQEFPVIVTAVDFDDDAVEIRSADNKPFPNSGGDLKIVVDPGWKFLTPTPRVDPNSIIAVSPSMRKTTEASYEGNIGIMELFKFFNKAEKEDPKLVARVKEMIKQRRDREVWRIIQDYTGTQLTGKEFEGSIKEAIFREAGHGKYWCSTDKKWKYRQGPKQSRSS